MLYDLQADAWSRDVLGEGTWRGSSRLPDARLLAFARQGMSMPWRPLGSLGDGADYRSGGAHRSRTVGGRLGEPLFVGDVVLVADRADGSTLTFTRTASATGATTVGVADLTETANLRLATGRSIGGRRSGGGPRTSGSSSR